MIDSIGPINFDESNVIDSIAFGLATLERHGDRTREIERLAQQISLVRNEIEGPLGDLLWATENLLSSVRTGTLSDQEGLRQVLQDLAQFLHSASKAEDPSPFNIEEVDELLERLDFLASGGTDREVPKRDRSGDTPTIDFRRFNFPIESSPDVEDPVLTSLLERVRSTGHLLSANLETSNDRRSRDLIERNLQQLRSIDARINEQSLVRVDELVRQLTDSIKSDSELQTDRARIEIKQDSTCNDHVYKSLANFLVPIIKALMKTFTATADSGLEASFELQTVSKSDEMAFSFRLKGIKSKLADRMESTLRSLALADSSERVTHEGFSQQDSASSPMIQSALLTYAQSIRSIGGLLFVERDERGEFEIKATVGKNTRLAKVVPVTIDSDRYGIEAYLVQAVVPANNATCDIYRNLVVHAKHSYEYRTLGATRKLDKVSSTDLGLMVLMDYNSWKVAVHVDKVHEIETLALSRSSSNIEFGNTMSLPPNNLLQLDLQSDLSNETFNSPNKTPTSQSRHSLYHGDVSASLADRLNIATRGSNIECKFVHGIFETIRAIQERKPRFLVLQDSNNGSNWLDQLRLMQRYNDLSSTQIMIATTDGESHKLRFGSEFSKLKWIPMDIQVPDLVDLLTNSLGSEEF